MGSSHKTRYTIWINQSKYDLQAAEKSIENKFYEWTCYQSVQAVEKVLKGVLIHSGWRPPKIHKLGILLSMCNHANKDFFQVKLNFRKLEAFTFISRYPFVMPGSSNLAPHDLITKDDAMACLQIAQEIVQKVGEFLGEREAMTGELIDMENVYYTEEEIEDRLNNMIELLVHDQQLDVQKIMLFGSFAREKTRPRTSTMDILVIAKTTLQFIERINHVREISKGEEPIIEPIVYTPEEFDLMVNEEGEGFLESAIDEGRVIWEK